MTATDLYSTHDLNLAAFLLARGHPLRAVAREPGGRCVFRYPATAREDAPGFLAKVAVPAWDFANALRSLKARVRESY
jgi:hypothetical protein